MPTLASSSVDCRVLIPVPRWLRIMGLHADYGNLATPEVHLTIVHISSKSFRAVPDLQYKPVSINEQPTRLRRGECLLTTPDGGCSEVA